MRYGPFIFLGILCAVLASWLGVVVAPQLQFGDQALLKLDDLGIEYPLARNGEAKQGAEVYRAEGCNYCHTQQVRSRGEGTDIARGWGKRRTVARDYLRDQPPMLGQVRFGPDLANIGERQTNATRLLMKLYNARIEMPGSTMPRFPYLFEERKLRYGEAPSPNALPLPGAFAPPAGTEVVPTTAALQLVAYLQSLKSETLFYEVFPPQPPKRTNQVAGANAPPATNAPAATNALPETNALAATNAPAVTNPPPAATNAPATNAPASP